MHFLTGNAQSARLHTIMNQEVTSNGSLFFVGKMPDLARYNGLSRPVYVNLEIMFYQFS
ncbi:hypothetical protein SAMN05216327_10328 [Dyadobacter sp. SG02]|nr:hypothetical protein SAMN05216327_10328 [Dyadobacter sp. SG02]